MAIVAKKKPRSCWQCLAIVLIIGFLIAVLDLGSLAPDVKAFSLQAVEEDVRELGKQLSILQANSWGAARKHVTSAAQPVDLTLSTQAVPSPPPPFADPSPPPLVQLPPSLNSQISLESVVRTTGVPDSTVQLPESEISIHAPGNVTYEFQQKRSKAIERYSKEFEANGTFALASSAARELELFGVEAERAMRKQSNDTHSKILRRNLVSSLLEIRSQQRSVYDEARANITEILKYKSKDGRLQRPIPQQLFTGHWLMTQGAESTCVEACNRVAQHCDVEMMENIISGEAMQAAVEAATVGITCTNYNEFIWYNPWDGPYFNGGLCTYGQFAIVDCSATIPQGLRRLCACSDKKGPTKGGPRPGMFHYIIPALHLFGTKLLMQGVHGGGGGDDRVTIGPHTLKALGHECVVYGFGVAYDFGYQEQHLLQLGCIVHVFDCTMHDGMKLIDYLYRIAPFPNMIYHPWCVGVDEQDSAYKGWDGETTGMFFRLDEIMAKFGHKEIDIMKFDIEGNEWKLFDLLLKRRRDLLPYQLAFELHTYGANRAAVPQELVGKKGMRETAELFDRLYEAGYMVVNKEVNGKDPSCMEIVMVRV